MGDFFFFFFFSKRGGRHTPWCVVLRPLRQTPGFLLARPHLPSGRAGSNSFMLNQSRLPSFTYYAALLYSLSQCNQSLFPQLSKNVYFCVLFIYSFRESLEVKEREREKEKEKKNDGAIGKVITSVRRRCMPGVKMVSSRLGQRGPDALQMCSWAPTVKVISIVITLFDFSSISCLLLSTLLLILARLQPRNACSGRVWVLVCVHWSVCVLNVCPRAKERESEGEREEKKEEIEEEKRLSSAVSSFVGRLLGLLASLGCL